MNFIDNESKMVIGNTVILTQEEYDELDEISSNIVYIIVEEEHE